MALTPSGTRQPLPGERGVHASPDDMTARTLLIRMFCLDDGCVGARMRKCIRARCTYCVRACVPAYVVRDVMSR